MRLYATTKSERASKGQGGNEYLKIELKDEEKNIFARFMVNEFPDGINISYEIDNEVAYLEKDQNNTLRGKKQKGDKCQHQGWEMPDGNIQCLDCGKTL